MQTSGHELFQVADRWSFLYVEKARISKENHAIVVLQGDGKTSVPCSALSVLMLGPGTTVTHAAIQALADNHCSAVWCGEGVCRFYAYGAPGDRRARHLNAQAKAWGDPSAHERVVKHMYQMRFQEPLEPDLTLEQVRGLEGVRVRETYAEHSRKTGVPWRGRRYERGNWASADLVNRALSASNACLYALCGSVISATGFSPGLGFVHTGKMNAFVYDVADLYKCDVTIPAAFEVASTFSGGDFGTVVRSTCRRHFHDARLLRRILPDMQEVVGLRRTQVDVFESAEAVPGALWDSSGRMADGGVNHGAVEEDE